MRVFSNAFIYTPVMRRATKLAIYLVIIIAAYFISSIVADKLDYYKVTSNVQVAQHDCNTEFTNSYDSKPLPLGDCAYYVSKEGWPFVVNEEYRFIHVENSHYADKFVYDKDKVKEPGVEYDETDLIEIPNQISDVGTCTSKDCLFQSDNALFVFGIIMFVSGLIYYLLGKFGVLGTIKK